MTFDIPETTGARITLGMPADTRTLCEIQKFEVEPRRGATSPLGQNRKSGVGLGMSGVGGGAEVDFGRLEVCL